MKRRYLLGAVIACCTYMSMAQSQTDTLQHVPQTQDSLSVAQADSTVLQGTSESEVLHVSSDSTSIVIADSGFVALRPLTKVDSTTLIMEKVKSVTNMISEQSFLNTQRVREVFSDTAIVNKYNRLLDKMVNEYAIAVDNISADDS